MTVEFQNVKSKGPWKQGATDNKNSYVRPPVWFRCQLWLEVRVIDFYQREYVAFVCSLFNAEDTVHLTRTAEQFPLSMSCC